MPTIRNPIAATDGVVIWARGRPRSLSHFQQTATLARRGEGLDLAGLQGSTPWGARCLPRPLAHVVLEPDRAGAKACNRSRKIWTGDVAGRGSPANTEDFSYLRWSREPELHAGTLGNRPEDIRVPSRGSHL